MESIIIIGSGPAAYTAAIYAARAQLDPLVFEGVMAGGQLTTTTHIENFPGFAASISGPDLMAQMRQQASNFGARLVAKNVSRVDLRQKPLTVYADAEVYQTRVLIIATGARAKRLQLPGEERLWQRGISACAVCDGALPIFQNKPIAVIGGGDSAVEEADFLSKYASKVYVIHRRDKLRASKIMQERLMSNAKIEVVWDAVATEALGDNMLNGLRLKNVKTGEERVLEVSGLFYAIGHSPNTGFLGGQVPTDEEGYIITRPGSTLTDIDGVFACGDVQDKTYRQAVTAAGSGCMAAIDAERYLLTAG